jgi:integrase
VWELRFYEAGKRKTVTVGTKREYATESAVRKSSKMQALLMAINADNPSARAELLFGAVVARYEQHEMPARYSTRAAYKSNLEGHIKPRWDAVGLSAIKPVAVEDWLNGLEKAPKTKAHIRGIMHVIFNCAVRWELIERNPIDGVRLKGGAARLGRSRILEVAEFNRLVASAKEPFRSMFLIAGCLGLRCSEIVGLQWADFDFEKGTLLLQRGIVHGRIGPVKTQASRGAMPIDPVLAAILSEHRKVCFPTAEGWLFANPLTGKPFHQEEIQKRHIQKAAELAQIKGRIGWHSFRHSYRSWLDQVGASMAVQKDLMRHSSITTTMDIYGAVVGDGNRLANSNVVQMLLPKPSTMTDQLKAG